jgi:hypothetical protein
VVCKLNKLDKKLLDKKISWTKNCKQEEAYAEKLFTNTTTQKSACVEEVFIPPLPGPFKIDVTEILYFT